MARLPTPGQDDGVWGNVLNDFLSVEHATDGTLKIRTDGTFYAKPSGGVPASDMAGSVQTTLSSVSGKVSASTVTTKGDLLAASAASTVSRLAAGSNGQFLITDGGQALGVRWADQTVVRAEYYGVTSDGVTDESANLQAAVNAAASQNIPLVIGPGTIIIGTAILVSQPVTIIGSGRDATVLKAKTGLNDYVITFSGGSAGVGIVAAHFADFSIDGNSVNQTAGGGILAVGAVQCTFERLHLTSCYNWGLELGPITGGAFGHHNRVINCLFDNSASSLGYGGGLWMTSSDENWIIACDFENLGGASFPTGTAPIMLYDLAGLQTITACCFVGGANNCIAVRIQNVERSRVTDCTFDGTAGDSIFLVTNKCLVANNTITGPGTLGSAPASGVHLEFNTHYNVVSNNILICSDTASKTRSLVREESTGGSSDNLIEGNSLTWGNNGPTVALIESAGTNTIVRDNIAWATEATGTTTVSSGNTSIAVPHGLAVTPTLANISVTPTNSLGNATKFWISNPTATQFTVNVNTDPGAGTATFSWMAKI